MFLSRTANLLGNIPVGYRLAAARKRRLHQNSRPENEDENFFGTSCHLQETEQQEREHEVSRLFSRMRAELLSIARGFADDEPISSNDEGAVRHGILVEMIVASEFLMDELDSEIANIYKTGKEAQAAGETEKLAQICRSAAIHSKLRLRISEFQRELDSMLDATQIIFDRYSMSTTLEYDPFAEQNAGLRASLCKFTAAVDQTISVLAQLSFTALHNKDFETVAELCSCNVQLSNFLNDSKRIYNL
jgi:hypothetical protein